MSSARRRFLRFAALPVTVLVSGVLALAQTTPVLVPSTISTYAGGPTSAPAAVGAGKLCNGGGTPGTGNTLPVATDAFNDGCPAAQAIFSTDPRGGLVTDPLGNVFILDGGNSGNNILRKIDARSGLITEVVGGATTNCSGAVDKEGDGCPFVNAGNFNNPRGVGGDPYGNVVIAGYSDGLVHAVCYAVSPLCSAAQVGKMVVVAGCTTTTTAYGSNGNGADGVSATPTGTCSTSVAELNQPRGATVDAYGNVLIGDTANQRYRLVLGPATYNGVTNPLYAIIKMNPTYSTPTQGYIYAVAGGYTATASGSYCVGTSGAKSLDAYGNGCPFYKAGVGTSGSLQAGAIDANGNVFFYDYSNTSLVRVLYVGGTTVANAIAANYAGNANFTGAVAGSIYLLAGGGSASPGTSPMLGTLANFSGQIYKMNIDQRSQNLIFSYSANVMLLDMSTGYVRKIASGGTVCTAAQSATGATPNTAGDGCPATAANFAEGNGLGVATDNLGNLYLADSTNLSIRKVSTGSYTAVAAGSTYTPNFIAHTQPSAGNSTVTSGASTDFTLAAPTCVTNNSTSAPVGDNTIDCTSVVTFKPTGLGLRSAPVTVTPTTGTAINSALTGIGTGTALVFDPASPAAPSTSTIAGTLTGLTSVAIDGAGNLYTASVQNGSPTVTEISVGTASTIYTTGTVPTQVAVDPQGNVYGAVGSATIGKLNFTAPSTFSPSGLTNAAIANVKAIAVDANQNVYVADSTNNIIKFSQTTGQALTLTATALSNPVALALDYQGNVLIADAGAGAIYKLSTAGITSGLPTVVLSGIAPVAVAADPAGDIYYLDSSSKTAVMIPVTGATTTILTGLVSPKGIALDGLGNVYVADSSVAGVTKITRSQYSYVFASTSATLGGTLTNIGNVTATGFSQGDSADFQLAGSGATCVPGTSSIAPGAACTIVASFTPQGVGGGTLTNVVSLKPTATTFGNLTLSGTVAGNAVTTTTVIGSETPASPTYLGTGTEVTFTITVTASNGNPTGSVNVSLDGAAATAYPLTTGTGNTATATVALSGLIAATHTLSATYPTTGAYTGSGTTSPTNFSIAQATTALTWSPSAMSQQYSAAIGTGVFDAYALSGSTVVPGAFVYTATPSGGTAQMVDSASYLGIGSYTLAVSFTPTDTVDYVGSTQTLSGTYTVTKATTTGAVGASQFVVAADGSGNFTSVESAVSALPVTGGSIYIAPGTYTGQVLVPYPNTALRGLGGNPANVVITSETGAFATNTGFGVVNNPFGFNNDEGSATLVVSKGTVGGTSYTPTNFYMDNLSLINTYDSDTTNTNAITGSNQSCTATTTSSNNTLYNAGTLCASQALTLWITADMSVLNNVRMTSLQDTLAAYDALGTNACSGESCSSRQYYWKNYITGDIDYVFGDAAAVFDQTSFYTTYHNGSNTGNATVFAQNKYVQTGTASDYLSGYVANNSSFTSQATPLGAMTSLYYGRPYGVYATTVLINSSVDDVAAAGWEVVLRGESCDRDIPRVRNHWRRCKHTRTA